jgi:hypothetical protein
LFSPDEIPTGPSYTVPTFDPRDFTTTPSKFNSRIPANIDLVCGDPLLELQANAINTLSNTQIPGAPYTFAQLKSAQAVGDFQTLEAHDRRTTRIHFDKAVTPTSALAKLFAEALA